ncbi:MAG: glycerol-3-phosphate 1-O-acyltransferase PlsY [Pseudomonadota bacterium]|jgi:glycerol-3-phosphate acyltransferase PlsY
MDGFSIIALLIAAFLGGYASGSIPFGLLLTRMAGMGDIRSVGSGNIGATNVLRTGRKGIALATLLLDALKGVAPVLYAARYGEPLAHFAAAGAVVGHVFPVWLGFRGGKGVATSFGVMLAVCWPAGLAGLVTWAGAAAVFRYSSLAALLAMAAMPVAAWIFSGLRAAILSSLISLLVVACHRTNIVRLWHGEEPKIGAGKP